VRIGDNGAVAGIVVGAVEGNPVQSGRKVGITGERARRRYTAGRGGLSLFGHRSVRVGRAGDVLSGQILLVAVAFAHATLHQVIEQDTSRMRRYCSLHSPIKGLRLINLT